MLERAKEIISDVSKQTDSVLLMHSLTGKDSIALLDLIYPHFKRVVCCFMYTLKGLEHINRYYVYAKKKYPNIEFVQVPHYSLISYQKYGFLGTEGNENQRLYRFGEIVDKVREQVGVEWVCIGFKQSDSLNRRLMLRSYKDGKEAICYASKRFYPLSTYKNKDVLDYIYSRNLKNPESYDTTNRSQSNGVDFTGADYLLYLREKFPRDLEKIYATYPASRLVIDRYFEEQKKKEIENESKRNKGNQEESNQPQSLQSEEP